MSAYELIASIATPAFVVGLAWLLAGREPEARLVPIPVRVRRRD